MLSYGAFNGVPVGLKIGLSIFGRAHMVGRRRRRRRRRGDVKREQMLAYALQSSHADVTRITVKVLGSTVVLGGHVATSQDRDAIIACVLGYVGIGR